MEKHLSTFLLSIFTAVSLWVGVSVSDLNKNVAVVLEKIASQEKRITTLEGERKLACH